MLSLEEKRFYAEKKENLRGFEEALKEGKVDRKVIRFCKFVFSTRNYYTLSSCSGRILLLAVKKGGTKRDAFFAGKWHEKVKVKDVIKIFEDFKEKNYWLWLKAEPFIYHIAAKNIFYAKEIIKAKSNAGIKRGGIFVIKPGRIISEIIGTQEMSLPIKFEDKEIITEEQLKVFVKVANEKLEKNDKQRKRFEKECKKLIKNL